MNQGRIWCVVHPTIGLPLLLGSVALTSLAVHTAVMTHTTWMSNYWQGASRSKAADNGTGTPVASANPKAEPAFIISVAPVAGTPGKLETAFVVTVAPNPAATNPAAAATTASAETPRSVTATLPITTAKLE